LSACVGAKNGRQASSRAVDCEAVADIQNRDDRIFFRRDVTATIDVPPFQCSILNGAPAEWRIT